MMNYRFTFGESVVVVGIIYQIVHQFTYWSRQRKPAFFIPSAHRKLLDGHKYSMSKTTLNQHNSDLNYFVVAVLLLFCLYFSIYI